LRCSELKDRAAALREGLARLSEQLASRTDPFAQFPSTPARLTPTAPIDASPVKMRSAEQNAQATFDRTPGGYFPQDAFDRSDVFSRSSSSSVS